MEEYLTKKIVTNDLDESIKTYAVFDWKVSSKEILGYKTLVTFVRNTDAPYYQQIVELEKKWNKETTVPSWPGYLLLVLTFLTVSTYLIVSIITGFQNKKLYFFSIMLPGLILLMLASTYFMIRGKKIEKILVTYYDKRHEYDLKIKEIKGQ